MARDDRLGNPHRIGLTDAERAVFSTGHAVATNGLHKMTEAHLNVRFSLADIYAIRRISAGTHRGVERYYFEWFNRRTYDTEKVDP